MSQERAALGAFLRSRRDRLSPAEAGMRAFPGPRRVPGLRKEELAMLAGLSADYYSRLEQGRQATVSAEVLDALARALRLDEVEHAHLHDLAAPGPARGARGATAVQRPDQGLIRLMGTLDHVPVLLLGNRGDVLARNLLLTAVLGRPLPPGSSFVRYLFQDPVARERIVNWAVFAAAAVASLRRETARHPYDRQLTLLIEELRSADEDVTRWWDDHTVRDYASVTKRIEHPTAGRLDFGIEFVAPPQEPDQRLVIYTTEPHSRTAAMLPLLASWSADLPFQDAEH
ncbi:helix-turn-helix transcriptional regulator [Actinoplanes derwentensis]|uniref:Helix-turn-helix domain-containing protein n=1 Tax=Actinoplanes derwentensis TaxID=113562 RepID=A0A1H1WV07_9ACTN|nr:helix-turn-helix transcriptional regulator [Actinoplanes derwentensis]GID86985.1 transcriptional regulator [Actinoplanes derwentensis]SDT00196.1 Helix-turn-helix domain-containing protein [Actinoplanes derwentensis]